MKQLFLELIQVAMGQRECLERGPEPGEWLGLYEMSRQQKVTGISYKGVVKLFDFGLRAPQDVSIDWMAEAEEMRETNEGKQKPVYVARYYDEELRSLRQPTDEYYLQNKALTISDVYRLFVHQRLDMRVVMDYYYILRSTGHRYETLKFDGFAGTLFGWWGVRKFAHGMMWVLQQTMGLDRSLMLCEPWEEDGRFILQEMMDGHSSMQMLKKYLKM